jgi:hypothetical protein
MFSGGSEIQGLNVAIAAKPGAAARANHNGSQMDLGRRYGQIIHSYRCSSHGRRCQRS